jgi:hypothetical protein
MAGTLVCACTPLSGQAVDSLSTAERAEILNEILGPELARTLPALEVEPCSVFLALGRDPQFAERLKPQVRSRLAGPVRAPCGGPKDIKRKTSSGWMLREVKQEGTDRVSVLATVWHLVGTEQQLGHHQEAAYTAEYTLRRKASSGQSTFWSIDQIKLYDFVTWVYH